MGANNVCTNEGGAVVPCAAGVAPDLESITLLTHPWVFIPLLGSHLLPPLLRAMPWLVLKNVRLRLRLILRQRLPLMPGIHTTDVPAIMVMGTAMPTGAIMGAMLATMGAMEAMAMEAMVVITVLDTDTMVESDAAMGMVALCPALLENRLIRNKKTNYFFFLKKKKKKKKSTLRRYNR